jgi:hypothetical protein
MRGCGAKRKKIVTSYTVFYYKVLYVRTCVYVLDV